MSEKFVENSKYSFKFIGDANVTGVIHVVKRTEKTITIFDVWEDVKKRCKIFIDNDGNEFIYPLGRQGMSPVAKATKKIIDYGELQIK